jgi:HlyD family secretion protein
MKTKPAILILATAAVTLALCFLAFRPPPEIKLTGMVTTDEVIVSPEIQGRIQQLLVGDGDTVTNGQLLAVLRPETQQADLAFYTSSEQQFAAQMAQARANLENARLNFEREQDLHAKQIDSSADYDLARTTYDAAVAQVEALNKQTQAAGAQKQKAQVQLGYTEIRAPLNSTVDSRAALAGEVVNPGQAIVTLINPDDLWVRADVEESYIDRIRLGDKLPVTFSSGAVREGVVYYRSVDADYATQRDVSRSKRDIKTFEIRLRCNNQDRALAVGMTAYVKLSLDKK